MYKMKDFGNDNYSGDCFFLVGQLKGLDCNRALDFIEILETIDRDLGLGLSSGTPVPISQTTDKRLAANTPVEPPEKPVKPYQFREQKFSSAEMEYWRQILAAVRHHSRSTGTLQGLLTPGIQQ